MSITGGWDHRITRRTLLRTGGSLAAGLAVLGGASARAFAVPRANPFTLGVASGDPLPDGVVLWTRLAPDPQAPDGGLGRAHAGVRFEVAEDESFRHPVRRGAAVARPAEAHAVHVEVGGLEPGREYFYRFAAGPHESPVGRTRTAPAAGAAVGELRFAFVSCQHWAEGYFTPYADVAAARDLELVVHLGDYIYEGAASHVRTHFPAAEIRTLTDYRLRHAQYKTDPDLQAAHAALPWLATWDDHEVENNYADEDADPNVPVEEFLARRAAAYQAYWEHMPLRRSSRPRGPDADLYRRFRWGSLATLNVLDGRQYRSDQPPACSDARRDARGYCPGTLDPSRTMLGAAQRDWLLAELATTTAQWNVLANQTAFAPIDRDARPDRRSVGAGDNWSGYPVERQTIIDALVRHRTPNPIVLTGDSHDNWIRHVPPDDWDLAAPPVATEFMGTSISSNGTPSRAVTRFADDPQNPHIVFRNNQRGYVRCTVGPDAWRSDFRTVESVSVPVSRATTLASFVVEDGRPGAILAGAV